MTERARTVDLVARLGGDEFAIILTDTSAADVDAIVRRFGEGIAEPIPFGGHQLQVGCSIGASLHPNPAAPAAADGLTPPPDRCVDPNDLLAAADEAMYQIKRRNKGGYAIAQPPGAR
jgi:diguanylate cyclase (GGDEF)-like protein